jgi:hypothetical protein
MIRAAARPGDGRAAFLFRGFHMTPSTRITPFWLRLRAITLYPMRGAALLALLGLTGLSLLTLLPFTWLFRFLLLVGTYTYAVSILRDTANGYLDPPEINADGDGTGKLQIVLQFVFSLLLVGAFLTLGPVGGFAVALVLAFAMPGATLSLALDENFWHAINPATWFAIAARLGWPYFAMLMLCVVIMFSQGNAQALIEAYLPPVVAQLAATFVSTYAVFATFHLMGYVIYQYHEELGYEISRPTLLHDHSADPDQGVLDEVEAMVLDGDTVGAEARLAHQLRVRGGTAAVHARYRKLLRLRGDVEASSRHGNEYLAILMAQGKEKEALELVRDCLAIDPDFQPAHADAVRPLARRAAETAHVKLAVQLLSGFEQRHPGHADIAANALAAAKLLAEKLGDESAARTLLAGVRPVIGNDPLRQDFEAYQQFLDRLAAPVAKA